MTRAEAEGSGNLVIGHCMIVGKACCVLYDSGATHSFVLDACVKKLSLSMCVSCSVNLWCLLRHRELELILGMDWLSTNCILIDCREKKLLFPISEEPELLTSQGVMKELQGGAQCYIIFTHLEVEKEEGTSVIPVVHEFEDVFPTEVPGLPPNREVEFSIDLVPGTGPVSMAPYRMAPTELVELKSQIEELLGK
ncbi:uncharacterized protein LOC114180529 [Vigna unguiculata]|uniref:uncharacterized protein LOC114180529 n=1 Tax=Vigna unguiculata TaxID=3917 RepID=UPI001016B5C6|nr:uncharacterized protein LOC114180529 [Vigna unguiculata]